MSDFLSSSHRDLLIHEADRIAHQIIKEPCVQISSYDQMPSRSDPPEVFEYRMQIVCFRKISFYESNHNLVRGRLVGVDYIRLHYILDSEALLQKISMRLILQARLSVPRKTCMLRRQDRRFKQWIQHQLCCVSDQLMHDT